MLSILIPTYNYNVVSLVESLSGQLKEVDYPYEILVADDASNNPDIVEKNRFINQFPHTSYLEQTENKGRTATRNLLARSAKYASLLFMDADVLPKRESFIQNFDVQNNTSDVVFGGIAYEENPPEKDKILRWKYGKAREAKPVSERKKIPYLSLISGCCFIKKDVFLKANNVHENKYGVDVLFAENLQNMNASVLHIENPCIHLGLEDNEVFIEKTKKGLETLALLSKQGKISNDYRPIQQAYKSLKKNHLLGFFNLVLRSCKPLIEKNLKRGNPSLFLFDLYRLHYYATLKPRD